MNSFPTVFKYPLKSKACRQILKSCPFPSLILQLGRDKVLTQIKKAVKKTIGQKRVEKLLRVAKDSHLWHIISQVKINTVNPRIGADGKTTHSSRNCHGTGPDPYRVQRDHLKYTRYRNHNSSKLFRQYR